MRAVSFTFLQFLKSFTKTGERQKHWNKSPCLEPLEDRLVFAIDWVPAGPTSIINGQVSVAAAPGIPDPVTGAVQSLASDPNNANILYAATVNGGVWKTTNALDPDPLWKPLTDKLKSLAIGDIAISPNDETGNTIFAGTGNYSHFHGRFELNYNLGGQGVGILKSVDGGAKWETINPGDIFSGKNIRFILPVKGGENVVLAGTMNKDKPNNNEDGLYRSEDNGQTWKKVSGNKESNLPNGGIGGLAVDPNNNQRLFTTVSTEAENLGESGFYESSDQGKTWKKQNSGIDEKDLQSFGYYRVAAAKSNQKTVVYLGFVKGDPPANPESNTVPSADFGPKEEEGQSMPVGSPGTLKSVYTKTYNQNSDTDWSSIGIPTYTVYPKKFGEGESEQFTIQAGGQGLVNFSFLAGFANGKSYLFVGGDTVAEGKDNSKTQYPLNHDNFTGVHARYDSGESKWKFLGKDIDTSFKNKKTTSPHADSRNMVFDKNGNIIECDDGGIYRLIDPMSQSKTHKTHWESVNGNLQISEPYSISFDYVKDLIFFGAQDVGAGVQLSPGSTIFGTNLQADGAFSGFAIDPHQSGKVIHYQSNQNGSVSRFEYSTNVNKEIDLNFPDKTLNLNYGKLPFITPFVVDPFNNSYLLIGGSRKLLLSPDLGNSITSIGDLPGEATTLAFGPMSSTRSNVQFAYAGTGEPQKKGDGHLVVGTIDLVHPGLSAFVQYKNYQGGTVFSIAPNPYNSNQIFVTANNGVFATNNATDPDNATFNKILDIPSVLPKGSHSPISITFATLPRTADSGVLPLNVVLIGAEKGVFANFDLQGKKWLQVGQNLPNAQISDLLYNPNRDLLVVGTIGRGIWEIPNASRELLSNIKISPIDSSLQRTDIGNVFANRQEVLVKDASGNPIPGIPVTFSSSGTLGGPGGNFVGESTVLTDINGKATAPKLLATGTPGQFKVTASIQNQISTSFPLENDATIFATGKDQGGAPEVIIRDQTGRSISRFFAYDLSFKGGVRVATGDVNHDGFTDVILSPGPGVVSRIKVVDGRKLGEIEKNGVISKNALLADFVALGPRFTGGVYVATGKLEKTEDADVIVGAGPGGAPVVKAFKVSNGKALSILQFNAYESAFRGGVRVSTGKLDDTGFDQIVTSPGNGHVSEIKIFDAKGSIKRDFFAFQGTSLAGAFVSVVGKTDTQDGLIIVGPGGGSPVPLEIYRSTDLSQPIKTNLMPEDDFLAGIRVRTLIKDQRLYLFAGIGPVNNHATKIRIYDLQISDKQTNFAKLQTVDEILAFGPDSQNRVNI